MKSTVTSQPKTQMHPRASKTVPRIKAFDEQAQRPQSHPCNPQWQKKTDSPKLFSDLYMCVSAGSCPSSHIPHTIIINNGLKCKTTKTNHPFILSRTLLRSPMGPSPVFKWSSDDLCTEFLAAYADGCGITERSLGTFLEVLFGTLFTPCVHLSKRIA